MKAFVVTDFNINLLLLVVIWGLGWTMVAYYDLARRYGWTVGEWYTPSMPLAMIIGALSIIASPVAAVVLLAWWTIAVLIFGGTFVGTFIARTLGPYSQIVAPVALIATGAVAIFRLL